MQGTQRIAIAGDWHGNTQYALEAIEYSHQFGAEVLIHTGDYGFWFEEEFISLTHETLEKNNQTLMFIDGNHDDHDFLAEVAYNHLGLQPLTSRIFHIPRGFRWSYQVDEIPITFMGVGGAISIDRRWRKTYYAVNGGRPLYWEAEAITDADVEKAIAPGVVDILITHDAPMGTSAVTSKIPLEPMLQADCDDSRRKLRQIVNATKPRILWHGHHHYFYEEQLLLEDGRVVEVTGLDCDGAELYKNVNLVDLRSLSHHLNGHG